MRFLKYLIIFALGLSVLVALVGVLVLANFSRNLPSIDAVKNYTPLIVTTLYSDDDKAVAEFSEQRRKALPPADMPRNLINAFVAAEDNEFFTHRGVNPIAILRAAFKSLEAGRAAQGGSTITQQVAKQILLSPEKSLSRKIRELLLSFKIEKALTKQEIIALYLNHIYLGNGAYGVEAAAQTYFGKDAKDLTVPEAAILAGLPKAPTRDNPINNPKAAKQRQTYVLGRMLANNMVTRAQHKEAVEAEIQVRNRREMAESPAPYFTEYVRRYLMNKYGKDMVYGAGLKVYTTLNLPAQLAAQDAIKVGLIALDKRAGFRRPAKQLKTADERKKFLGEEHEHLIETFFDYKLLTRTGALAHPVATAEPTPLQLGKNYEAVVTEKDARTKNLVVQVGNRTGTIVPADYKWAGQANYEEIYKEKVIRNPLKELEVGDVVTVQVKALRPKARDEFFLEQEPLVQGALVSYRIPDGALSTLVGGYDFTVTHSEFNRAVQAVRQPGSTFKPFVYGAALDAGLTPSTVIVDSPIVYRDTQEQSGLEKTWRPDNYGEKFYGDTLLRNALAYSRNIPTIKLLQYMKVQKVIEFARKMGINSKLNADLSLALGSSGVTLDELVRAWSVYANHGERMPFHFIRKIVDRNGKTLEEFTPPAEPTQVIAPTTAFLMTSLLKSVVEFGTATVVKALNRPVAGKTGTTNDYKDALFLGYTPQIITGVWTGFDEDRPIGRNETGTRAAAPIWLQYMQTATAGMEVKDFAPPEGIVQVQIDGETGDLPTARTRKRVTEYYADGTAPGQIPKPALPGPDGKPPAVALNSEPGQPNRTLVITGNPDVSGAPSANGGTGVGGAPAGTINTDELMRDEL